MWVLSGFTNANTAWVLITPAPIIIGVTPLNFVLFNQVTDVVGGTGITVTIQTGIHTISLNNQTQNLLANAISGVTNIGIGSADIYSSTINNKIQLRSLLGSGGTTVNESGNSIVINTIVDSALNSGSINPVSNSAITTVINQILGVIAVHPTYYAPVVGLTIPTSPIEMGTTLSSFAMNISFTQNDAGSPSGYELCRNGLHYSSLQNNTMTEANITSPISYIGSVTYACGPTKNNNLNIPDPYGKILAGTSNSPTRTIIPYLYQFYNNTTAIPLTSAQVRTLGSCSYSYMNTFDLLTGTVNCVFAFAIPNTKSKVSVIDITNLGADITSCYALINGSFVVYDIGGNSHNYNLYAMQTAIPYSPTATHRIIVS
jgi:hypothetical protein